jgi:hypothetical protein
MNKEELLKKDIRRFKVDDGDTLCYTAVALVESPAIQTDFIYFSNNEKVTIEIFDIQKEKQIISGPMMIPNLPIKRRDDLTNEIYYGYFTEEDIFKCLVNMQKFSLNGTVNLGHNQAKYIDGITQLEVFIIDTERGIMSPKGFNLPNGTLFATYKVDNKQVWEDVKNGTFKGFSVEGYFNSKSVKKEQTLLDELLAIAAMLN